VKKKTRLKKFKREADLERWCCNFMKGHKLDPRKQNVINYRGRTDRMVLGKKRYIVFVEFKLPGQDLTPLQRIEFENLKKLGFRAVICRSTEDVYNKVVVPYLKHIGKMK
jgi:hypothetical protein